MIVEPGPPMFVKNFRYPRLAVTRIIKVFLNALELVFIDGEKWKINVRALTLE